MSRAQLAASKALKFDKEAIPHCFDLPAVVSVEASAQGLPVPLERLQGQGFVSLSQRSVSYHVCEHDCCESPLRWMLRLSSTPRLLNSSVYGQFFSLEPRPLHIS